MGIFSVFAGSISTLVDGSLTIMVDDCFNNVTDVEISEDVVGSVVSTGNRLDVAISSII